MAKTNDCVFLDFETRSFKDIDDGAFAYAADESTDILCIAYAIEDEPTVVCTIDNKELLAPLFRCIENGYKIVAHNMLFEIAIIKYVAIPKYNWPKPSIGQFRCTMQMSGRAGLPLSLDEASKSMSLTEKLQSGKHLIKLFSIPHNGKFVQLDSRPKDKQSLLEYCANDVVVCRELWKNLPQWKEVEIEDVIFDLRSNIDGVPIDSKSSKIIHDRINLEQERYSKEISVLTKGLITKPTQTQRIRDWVRNKVNPSVPDCTADTVQEIIDGKYGEVDGTSMMILEMRQHSGKSSTGKYVRYCNSAVDSRICGMNISFGAHTGRAVSKLLNLYNLPKPSVKYESMEELVYDLTKKEIKEVNEKYGSYLKAASTAIRGMIEAPEGKILYISDYAAIEARLVFWLADCMSGIKKYLNKEDLYIDQASKIFNKRISDITSDERWVGKQVILGAGYGLGPKGFVLSCARWGVEVSLKVAEDAISSYRESYEEIVDLWNDLERKAILAYKSGEQTFAANGKISFKKVRSQSGVVFLLMILPSGRFIMYPHVKTEVVTTPWGAKKKGITYKKVTNGGFFRQSTYGGSITENAVQGIARDLMYYGSKNAKANGYDILFHVYDEVVGMHDENDANIHEFNDLICKRPDWGLTIPLVAEGKICKRYQKI